VRPKFVAISGLPVVMMAEGRWQREEGRWKKDDGRWKRDDGRLDDLRHIITTINIKVDFLAKPFGEINFYAYFCSRI
jgi:hypothetical protein